MKSSDVTALAGALVQLGDKDACGVAAAWVGDGTALKALKAEDLSAFVQGLPGGSDAAKALRLRIADWLTKGPLATLEGTRALACSHWHGIASTLGSDLDAPTRAAWAAKLRAAYAEPKTLAALETDAVYDLRAAIECLGDKDPNNVYAAWMSASATWESMKPGQVNWLASGLAIGGDATKNLRERLAAHVFKKYLATPETARAGNCGNGKGSPEAWRRTWTWRRARHGPRCSAPRLPNRRPWRRSIRGK